MTDNRTQLDQPALTPAHIYIRPGQSRFQDAARRWQGIPSVAVTENGGVLVCFYAGDRAEVPGNFLVLCACDEGGLRFRSCEAVVEHPSPQCRLFDPALWTCPDGRVWLFYSQARGFNDGRMGVWCAVCDHPDKRPLSFSPPRRIANGVMLNKPTVLSNGHWLLPCALWSDGCGSVPSERHGLEREQFSNVYASRDRGETFRLRGGADVPQRGFDEHMLVEKRDGSLWMLVRTFYGIGESFSKDGGYTWSPGQKSRIEGPCSRFHISRLRSGRLLLVNHDQFGPGMRPEEILSQGDVKRWKGRRNLTAMLSEDDGETWPYKLLLDGRDEVSYPDAAQAKDGAIYIVYDRDRVNEREILLAKIWEEDILKGRLGPLSRLQILVNKSFGQ